MAEWDGRPYVTRATWLCLVVLSVEPGWFYTAERQVTVVPRFSPENPYDMIIDFQMPLVCWTLERDGRPMGWALYRLADGRWLHGHALDLGPMRSGGTVTLQMPDYDRLS